MLKLTLDKRDNMIGILDRNMTNYKLSDRVRYNGLLYSVVTIVCTKLILEDSEGNYIGWVEGIDCM